MKDGIRILGVDDSAFSFEDEQTALTGVVYRGTEFIEEIVFEQVTVDGDDATEKLLQLYSKCNNHSQLKVIMVDGLSFAGLNPVDIEEVANQTGKPVVAVTSNKPDRKKFRSALQNKGKKVDHLKGMDEYSRVELEDGPVYFQFKGVEMERAEEFIRISVLNGRTPECIRVADMIGSSLKQV
jgi:endonuclease V-like protein UPF0215 family